MLVPVKDHGDEFAIALEVLAEAALPSLLKNGEMLSLPVFSSG